MTKSTLAALASAGGDEASFAHLKISYASEKTELKKSLAVFKEESASAKHRNPEF